MTEKFKIGARLRVKGNDNNPFCGVKKGWLATKMSQGEFKFYRLRFLQSCTNKIRQEEIFERVGKIKVKDRIALERREADRNEQQSRR